MKLRPPKRFSPSGALCRLGFWQTLKGALIIGLLVGIMATAQGLAFGSTYPDEKSRTSFAATMESVPALGILYGETKNLTSSAGYMVYRTVPVMALVTSIWAVLAVTKLLRGQEEDGRWEVVTAASTTPRRASHAVLFGFLWSFITAFILASGAIALAGSLPELSVSLSTSFFVALAIFSPALLFAGLSVFASQLALTRRRATMYALTPLLAFFALRSLGNTVPDLYWLKNLTPFGWSDMINPILGPQAGWLIAFSLGTLMFTIIGSFLIGRRDLGAGFIHESSESKSRFYLLGSAGGFALRQNSVLFISWGIIALSMSLLIASIMGVAAEAVADSPSLGAYIGQLGGSMADMKIAFLGAGLVFVVITLLIMATICLSSIWRDEAKGYLDNLLTQPVRRSSWLVSRLLQIVGAFLLISILCVLATWVVAGFQNISLDVWNMLQISIVLTGTVVFLLGLGTLLYGTLPRLAVAAMYVVIAWSFIIDILGSVLNLNDVVLKSSLLHYVSLSPAETPDWGTFASLILLGTSMAAVGIFAFSKRDIVAE